MVKKLQFCLFNTGIIVLLVTAAFARQNQNIQQKLTSLEAIAGTFTFVVLGDNRSGDDIYRKIVGMAMERKPDFIVNVGDQIATPGSMSDWEAFWELSRPITVPYFLSAGNHDVHSKVPSSEAKYRDQVDLPGNELYYSFVAGNSLFIVLDTCLADQEKTIAGTQYQWLENVLRQSKHAHKFIFLHHPLHTEKGRGKHAGSSLDQYPAERDRLHSLLVKYNVDLVFAGHEHYYRRTAVSGLVQIITGGGGAPLYAKEEDGGFHHFILVKVTGKTVNAEVIDITGTVRGRF